MPDFQLTPPNVCAVINRGYTSPRGTPVVYVNEGTGYTATISVSDSSATFQEFETPEEALAAALLIDPSYPANNILGPLTLNPVTVSDPATTVSYGATVTLDCEYDCTDPAATVTYQWSGPAGSEIDGATASSYVISNVIPSVEGTYTCAISATNAAGQTGVAEGSFLLSVVIPRGQFYLTRNTNNISAGNFNSSLGFNIADSSVYFIADDVTVPYDALDGFKTVGEPLSPGARSFDLKINGVTVRSYTLGASSGTYTFNV